MRQKIDMDALWGFSLKQAATALAQHGGQVALMLAGSCPITLDHMLSDAFEFDDIVGRIAVA
jgi:hypothetical protein